MKPVTHPILKARLLRLARRIRYEGQRIKASELSSTHHSAYEASGVIALDESAALYPVEREAAEAWCNYAAEIAEAGAGGAAPLVASETDADRVSSRRP